jgi:Novel STAND NTPase 1
LADRLVSDAAEEPGALPLLQETMRLLWAEMARRFLPLGAYERLGADGRSGLAVAIANKADATLNDLPSAEQKAIARRIFLRLVQFGEGRPDTRRQQPVSKLREGNDPQLFDETLRHLEDDRLVTVTGEEGGQEKKVDLAHEAIITGWPQLREWVKERRGAEQTRRRLEDKAEEWIRLQRRGGLLDEIEIKEAEQWLQGPDAAELGGQSAALQDLLQASTKAIQEQKKQEEEARQRELEQARALAEEQQRFAEEQRQHAATAHRLALNALAVARLKNRSEAVFAGHRFYDFHASVAWIDLLAGSNHSRPL